MKWSRAYFYMFAKQSNHISSAGSDICNIPMHSCPKYDCNLQWFVSDGYKVDFVHKKITIQMNVSV